MSSKTPGDGYIKEAFFNILSEKSRQDWNLRLKINFVNIIASLTQVLNTKNLIIQHPAYLQ